MPPKKTSPLRILVVDDDLVDCRLIKRAFEETGIPVELRFAHSGSAALVQLSDGVNARPSTSPDGCIFDINMPGVSGIELLRKVKAHSELRKMPVVMLSSSHDRKDISQCYELQASGYLCKPDNYEELKTMIFAVTNFWNCTISADSRLHVVG